MNPSDLKALIAASGHDCAAVVIDGPDIAASTVMGLAHHEIASHAGFFNPWFDASEPEISLTGMLCLEADESGITLEVWPWENGPVCPCDEGLLQELLDRVRTHPKLSRMVSRGYLVDITVFDADGIPRWVFDMSGVSSLCQESADMSAP